MTLILPVKIGVERTEHNVQSLSEGHKKTVQDFKNCHFDKETRGYHKMYKPKTPQSRIVSSVHK